MNQEDGIDRGMLNYVSKHPGACVAHVVAPFLDQRSESILRARIRSLVLKKKLRLQKTKKEVLVWPVEDSGAEGCISE